MFERQIYGTQSSRNDNRLGQKRKRNEKIDVYLINIRIHAQKQNYRASRAVRGSKLTGSNEKGNYKEPVS